jgi:hypothetical protein
MVIVKNLIALALVIGSLVISSVGCGPASTTGPKPTTAAPTDKK